MWKKARANVDYHIEIDHNYYSVRYQLAKQELDVRLTASAVEALFKGKRVASHRRFHANGQYSTLKEHMPDSHRRYLEWSPSRIANWGKRIGSNTAKVVEAILEQEMTTGAYELSHETQVDQVVEGSRKSPFSQGW